MKKPSISKLKKKTWKIFSEYIRRKYADSDGFVECVCCGVKKHWKLIQASHIVPGRRLGILFEESGVFPCCIGCNVFKNGNYREFDAFIDRKFGVEYRIALIDDLRTKAKQPTKWSRDDFTAVFERFKGLLEGLEKV